MTIRQLIKSLSNVCGLSENEIYQRYRSLLGAKVISDFLPGVHARDFDAEDAAIVLLSILCGLKASEVIGDFGVIAEMEVSNYSPDFQEIGTCDELRTLVSALAYFIKNPSAAWARKVKDLCVDVDSAAGFIVTDRGTLKYGKQKENLFITREVHLSPLLFRVVNDAMRLGVFIYDEEFAKK